MAKIEQALRMPVKCAPLEFDDDGYPGFKAEGRLNLPMGVARGISAVDSDSPEDETRALWLQLFPSWNFCDESGEPIPHTVEAFDALPADLLTAMFTRRALALREAALPVPLETSSLPASNGVHSEY